MKMSIFGMLFILVALTVGPLVYFNGGAEYLDSMFSKKSNKPRINRDVVYAPVTTDERVKVFKWKDENGVWQFGNSPPPGLAGVESMTLQPNMNIMKPIDVPEDSSDERTGRSGVVSLGHDFNTGKSKDKKDKDGVGISKESLENPYAPESISELMKSSQNLQGVLNQRQQQQQNSLGK